ncbi:LysR family transcriptional regulator [Undibacterium terreum]|uniref:HTH-type transcriptional regulator GltR n=1 Tax=Undibacterium terreum TaxID=1224302 RepID=A0A916UDF8_9BURK|nr:LysR family transcriptional regulator [Undibacterium terreum]GGC68421.1 HTH-type transcriptional regulator GltR [Undibacterium terreum]
MDLSVLRIFKAVAEEGSVTKAAVRTHRVQSNVSSRLAQLEESLGVSLFHRSGRNLIITAEGTRLLEYADRLLQLAEEAETAVRGSDKPSGKLRIGSMETTAAARLPKILASFHKNYPEVDMLLETGTTDYLVQEVLGHRLDLALIAAPFFHPDLQQMTVFEEELVLVTDHAHAVVTSAHQVQKKTLLVFKSGCSYRRHLERWFADAGCTPLRTMEFGTYEAIIGCVAAGMGVALVPRTVLQQRELGDSIRVHTIAADIARVETLLIWRKDVRHHPARQAFAENLQALS